MRFRRLILPLVFLRDALNWMAHSPRQAFIIIFALSLAIRGSLLFSGVFHMRPDPVHETGHVAASLARSGRFADPYKIPTGLTAHPTPIYAGILGLTYRVFGVTLTAAYVRGVLAIVSFSALYGMLPWLGLRLGVGSAAGAVGGLAGALIPQQGFLESSAARTICSQASRSVCLRLLFYLDASSPRCRKALDDRVAAGRHWSEAP